MSARIHYDANRCQSTGVCEVTAAEIFLLDDEGIPQFDPDVTPELLPAARAAAQACPVQALSVSES